MSSQLTYLASYPVNIKEKIQTMLENNSLKAFLLKKYPTPHNIYNDKALRAYVMGIKNQYLKKSNPLSQVKYDDKIHVINNALGLHTYVSRVQGSKLKSKNELRIGSVFKTAPDKHDSCT